MLTELCCVNKSTDQSCKAKCLVEQTEKTDKQQKNQAVKVVVFFEVGLTFVYDIPAHNHPKEVLVSFYNNFYDYKYISSLYKPPVV